MEKKRKKGFTIVELVIVVAVIGILAAILIPTFSNLVNRANVVADSALVTNINTQLAQSEQVDGKNKTMYDALLDAELAGYKVANINARSQNELVWDEDIDRFVLLDKDGKVLAGETNNANNKIRLWKIYNSLPTAQTYSIYASDEFGSAEEVVVSVGFDAGNNDIGEVKYIRNASNVVAQTATIRTNSANTDLYIDAFRDTIQHYEAVGKVLAEKVDLNNCYNEFGHAAYIKVIEGKVVAKQGGQIDVAFAANNDGTKVAVIKETNGEIKTGYTVLEPVSDANEARTGGIPLVFSIDGEHAASATDEEIQAATKDIDTTGAFSVAAQTGELVLPEGVEELNYVAIVNNAGYESLQSAILAAQANDTVSLLKDVTINVSTAMGEARYYWKSQTASKSRPAQYRYVGVGLIIDKSLTINGNGHAITTTTKNSSLGDYGGVSLAVTAANVNLTLKDLRMSTTEMTSVFVGENLSNVKLTVDSCELRSASYTIKTCNGTDNGVLTIENSKLYGWATINARGNNSKFIVNNSDLSGENTVAASSSNNYASFVIDGDTINDTSTPAGTYGSNNTITITKTKISATSASSNSQTWLSLQYGALNNRVSVSSDCVVSPDNKWSYTDYEESITNTVTIASKQINGVIELDDKSNSHGDSYATVNDVYFKLNNLSSSWATLYVGVSEGTTGWKIGSKYFKVTTEDIPTSASNTVSILVKVAGELSSSDIAINGVSYADISIDTESEVGYTLITISGVYKA